MLISCWSAKGGAGTTVVAAALALTLARRCPTGALLVDLAGDAASVLGTPDPDGPGVRDWLGAGPRATLDALGRLEVDVVPGLALLPVGGSGVEPRDEAGAPPVGGGDPVEVIGRLLAADARAVVADCGTLLGPDGWDRGARAAVAAAAPTSLLVTRPCYVSLRRAVRCPLRPSGVVVVREPGRALGPAEVEEVLGVEVVACVEVDAAVARAVDAGILAARLPRSLVRQMEAVA